MTLPRDLRRTRAGLTLGLAFTITSLGALPLAAQPMSSGSGAGTGTGLSGGAARNSTGTGTESGSLGSSTGTGSESGAGPSRLPSRNMMIPSPDGRGGDLRPGGANDPGRAPRGGAVPLGPGATTTYPGDTARVPANSLMEGGLIGDAHQGSAISESHLRYARAIGNAADRSLALSRIASAATFTNQLDLAEEALADSSAAAMQIPGGLVHDQRLISIVTAQMNLAEARLREGRGETIPTEAADAPSAPLPPRVDKNRLIRRALLNWRQASNLSQQIGNPTYRAELTYRVADAMAFGSQSIVNEFPTNEAHARSASEGVNRSFEGLPDRLLREAADLCARIERPVWRDRGLVAVASAAAESRQFARALTVARMIPQPEVRTDALLKIAEVQARRNDPQGATASYKEAATAVASIPLDDPRAVLAGVLIDNLISVGRFDDARASIGLYPDEPRKVVALGAIAESQGRRGAAASAMAWINRDVPPEYRSQLYRRVSNGVVTAVEGNRGKDLSNRGDR